MRALVVDDEALARQRLVRMLARIDDVEVCGEAADGESALERIDELDPDVVFLDIQMPGLSGIELATSTPGLPPVVFTTAHSEHAVAAFEARAIDYLLKPIEASRLADAVQRVRDRGPNANRVLDALKEMVRPADLPLRVSAPQGDTLHFFAVDEITRFHTEQKYTVFQHDGHEYLCDEPLHALQARLAGSGWFRCHRSELIALAGIRQLRRVDDAYVAQLSDGQSARVSRRSVSDLKRALGLGA